jgi:hypothetical protein
VLDDLDKELTRRGHRFCRYADDCNIYVCSRRAGERVMASLSRFPTKNLLLKELVGLTDGVRENAQSWKGLLLDVKRRGLVIGPELAVADGAPGFWRQASLNRTVRWRRVLVARRI